VQIIESTPFSLLILISFPFVVQFPPRCVFFAISIREDGRVSGQGWFDCRVRRCPRVKGHLSGGFGFALRIEIFSNWVDELPFHSF